MRRPDLTEADAKAIKSGSPLGEFRGHGTSATVPAAAPASELRQGVHQANAHHRRDGQLGRDQLHRRCAEGRFFNDFEVDNRRSVVVLGASPGATLFPATDPLGKRIRIGDEASRSLACWASGRACSVATPNEFAMIPITTFDKLYPPPYFRGLRMRFLVIAVVPYPGVSRTQLIADIEEIMRSRHRLKLDQENDFDVLTSDVDHEDASTS